MWLPIEFKMKTFASASIIALMFFGAPRVLHAESGPQTLAELQERLETHLAQEKLSAAAIGMKIVSLETGKTLFERDADKLLKPASNAKLYTGALALDRFGPDHRIRTSVYAESKPDATGTVGDVLIYGRGDPSLGARFHQWDYSQSLQPLLKAFEEAGIQRIGGDLIGDDSFFTGPPLGSTWSWQDLQFYYGAEVSALTVDDSVIDLVYRPGASEGDPLEIVTKPHTSYLTFVNRTRTVAEGGTRHVRHHRPLGQNTVYVWGQLPVGGAQHTGAVAVHNPPAFFVAQLRDALARRGTAVAGGLRTFTWLEREVEPLDLSGLVEVAYIESRPMSELVSMMMKPSQNLYAQLLLLQAGASPVGSGQPSEQAGLAAMRRFLSSAGIAPGDVLLEEGSGLSRGCLLTPGATVQLLEHMNRHRHSELFLNCLPVAGVDGTLRARMRNTAAAGNVRAKTGTIRYVNALSGYVTSAAEERLAFSILLNNYNHPDGRPQIDAIAVMLAEFAGRSDE